MSRRFTILMLATVLVLLASACGRYGPPLRSNTEGDHRPPWAQTPPPPEPVPEEEATPPPAASPDELEAPAAP